MICWFLSQAFNAAINYYSIRAIYKTIGDQEYKSYFKELVAFSFPVALQESSFTVCHWAAVMFLTKYASAGDLGLYSAGGQWNSIIVMVPVLLNNVVLSYLSGNISNKDQHTRTVKTMILVNFVCTFVPFVFVYIFAGLISSFYGPTFTELPAVLRIMTLSTIFECCTSVFKSELMSQGRTWLLFSLRFIRDVSLVLATYFVLSSAQYTNGAITYAWIGICVATLFFIMMFAAYMFTSRHLSKE